MSNESKKEMRKVRFSCDDLEKLSENKRNFLIQSLLALNDINLFIRIYEGYHPRKSTNEASWERKEDAHFFSSFLALLSRLPEVLELYEKNAKDEKGESEYQQVYRKYLEKHEYLLRKKGQKGKLTKIRDNFFSHYYVDPKGMLATGFPAFPKDCKYVEFFYPFGSNGSDLGDWYSNSYLIAVQCILEEMYPGTQLSSKEKIREFWELFYKVANDVREFIVMCLLVSVKYSSTGTEEL